MLERLWEAGKRKAERLSQERKLKSSKPQHTCGQSAGTRGLGVVSCSGFASPGQMQVHLAPCLSRFIHLCSYF